MAGYLVPLILFQRLGGVDHVMVFLDLLLEFMLRKSGFEPRMELFPRELIDWIRGLMQNQLRLCCAFF